MLRRVLPQTFSACAKLRNIHTSAAARVREIFVEAKDDKTTVIEARHVASPKTPYILKTDPNSKKCPLCQLRLNIKHTDVLILNQFIDKNGEILRRSVTGLCKKQFKYIRELVFMAQYAGLLPEPPRKEPRKPYQLLNTYYLEDTINISPPKKMYGSQFYYLKLGPIEKLRVKPDTLP